MERYNIFNLVHKGLRASLFETALQLQRTDFSNEEAAEEAICRIREVLMLFETHEQKEDKYLLPAIVAFEPSIVASFDTEHMEGRRLSARLKGLIEKLAVAESFLERLITGRETDQAFVRFLIFNLEQMTKEEDVLNRILWRYYSDEEIMSMSKSIEESIEPWINDFFAKWILKGINNEEGIAWLSNVESMFPGTVFQTLLQKARQEWTADRYNILKQSTGKRVLVA